MEIFKIENLTFKYPNSNDDTLKNIAFSIKKGEFITLCGKSGCGKTTLLRLLKPQLSPFGERKGAIFFEGRAAEELTDRESGSGIGFVIQDPESQIVCDKVWHELAFGLENFGMNQSEIRLRVAECASYFGIKDWFYKDTSELSGGQKQILSLAAIVAMQPSVIILDEPTSQLDPIAATEFISTISRINRELGITVIISEHRTEELFEISDRVMVMDDGKIVCFDTPRKAVAELAGLKHDMLAAMPTAARIFFGCGENCPLTVREGRERMEQFNALELELVKKEEKGKVILSAEKIRFRYERKENDVLKGFSVRIFGGEIYAIVGGNGVGKSTALAVMGGILKPYSGKIKLENSAKTAFMPQSPSTLFVHKTVREDLETTASDEEQLLKIAELMGIEELTDRHPYDLSGGELQRAAFAKLLLAEPDILLLDEPTKGLDAHFKITLGSMLKKLKAMGKTIVIVSHDIEFCAEYADRAAMMFDGEIVSEGEPHGFFANKSFYTTAANRIARDILPEAITADEVRKAIGFETVVAKVQTDIIKPQNKPPQKKEKTKKNRTKLVLGIVFAALFILCEVIFKGRFTDFRNVLYLILSLTLAGGSVMCLVPFSNNETETVIRKKKSKKHIVISALLLLAAVPITILCGVYLFEDKNYYAISLAVIVEVMAAVAAGFENKKPKAEEIVVISVLCALAVAGRAAFFGLQQFKPVGAIVIVAGSCLGGEVGFLVGAVAAFVSNFFFGQGPWTPWQMISFGMMGLVSGLFFGIKTVRKNRITYSLFGFLSTLVIYGGIVNPGSMLLWEPNPSFEMIASSWIAGLPYDLVHAFSALVFLWFMGVPLADKLERMKTKYGL